MRLSLAISARTTSFAMSFSLKVTLDASAAAITAATQSAVELPHPLASGILDSIRMLPPIEHLPQWSSVSCTAVFDFCLWTGQISSGLSIHGEKATVDESCLHGKLTRQRCL